MCVESRAGPQPTTSVIESGPTMRRRALHLASPELWTAIFTGLLAITTMGTVWYARDLIRETRHDSQMQLVQAHKEEKIQHLLTMVSEFDRDPMATYRRDLAMKRLKGKQEDPFEIYRELDFFETVEVLVEHGYLDEDDVWNQFRWWVFNLNADDAVKAGLDYEKKKDPHEYTGLEDLVKRLQRVEAEKTGKEFNPTPQDVRDFFTEEAEVVSGKN
jgi:hypothetical protein